MMRRRNKRSQESRFYKMIDICITAKDQHQLLNSKLLTATERYFVLLKQYSS